MAIRENISMDNAQSLSYWSVVLLFNNYLLTLHV